MDKNWIAAFSKMTYGIYVLTTCQGDTINGMIASWVSQISYDPPLVLAAVHPNRFSHRLITKSGGFALHVLARDQKDYLTRFKGSDPVAKFSGLKWHKGRSGSPILADCQAYIDCRLFESLTPGNHTVFIGKVIDARAGTDAPALSTADYSGTYLGKS